MLHFDEKQRLWPAPNFQLYDADGRTYTRAGYRDRANLVLLFPDRSDSEAFQRLLVRLSQNQALFRAQEGVCLVLVPTENASHLRSFSPERYTVPLLADEGARVRAQYAVLSQDLDDAASFALILDRYGAPFVCFTGDELASDQIVDDILHQLLTLQLECPE